MEVNQHTFIAVKRRVHPANDHPILQVGIVSQRDASTMGLGIRPIMSAACE